MADILVSTTFDVANRAVATKPAKAKRGEKLNWSFSGFTGGAEI